MIWDAMRDGLQTAFRNALVTAGGDKWPTIQHNKWSWVFDEKSLQKDRFRGFVPVVETLHVFSATAPNIEKRQRQHHKGTTHALAITDVQARSHSDRWKVEKSEKTLACNLAFVLL